MALQFIGVGMFSYLISMMSAQVKSETSLQHIVDERKEDLDLWMRKLDSAKKNKSMTLELFT